MSVQPNVGFEHQGVASVLKNHWLKVPPNQREYSWEKDHVTEFFQDIESALGKSSYFLGTIVVTQGENAVEVVDGQQRLATTAILLAAIRDYFGTLPEERYMRSVDEGDHSKELSEAKKKSHKNLAKAYKLASEWVKKIADSKPDKKEKINVLNVWLKFLTEKAMVIVLTVPDDVNAYKMFETLNDRGLKTSQADLLKNYLFGECDAGSKLDEAQAKWAVTISALEPLKEKDAIVDYLRYLSHILHGQTTEKDVYEKLKKNVAGQYDALKFLDELAAYADDYSAILLSEHKKWSAYNKEIRLCVRVLKELGVKQIRPLLLAVARHFSVSEAELAFRNFVSWSVRALVGGVRGGQMEKAWTNAAVKVVAFVDPSKPVKRIISNSSELLAELSSVISTDAEFKSNFSTLSLADHPLARYYLRALEAQKNSTNHPEVQVIDDGGIVNLEHIMPKNKSPHWTGIDDEMLEAYARRLGNMCLINADVNNNLDNKAYSVKEPVYKASQIVLTQEVATVWGKGTWDTTTIAKRQEALADLAVLTWGREAT